MFVFFFGLWLLLSGQLTWKICLSGAGIALLVDAFCHRFLGYPWKWDRNSWPKLWGGLQYIGYLVVEMLKSGLSVIRVIYTRSDEIKPELIWFRTTLQSDWARAILADSITLTPGTITVESTDGQMCIHSLDPSMSVGIESSGFQQRLERLEGG